MPNTRTVTDTPERAFGWKAKSLLPGLCLVLTLLCLPSSAQGQSDDWEFVVAPYVLFGSLTGEAAIGRAGAAPIDLDFGDLLELLEIGAMVHAEAWKGSWGVMTDLIFMGLGADVAVRETTVLDIHVEELVAEVLVGRRFERPGRQVDLFAGARYWSLELELDLVNSGTQIERGDSWVDPVVGARLLQDLSEKWFLTARGDVGGFGVGSAFSWNAQGGIGFEISDTFSLLAQYRALDVDYENDAVGTSDFLSYVTTTHGPLLGFVFRF